MQGNLMDHTNSVDSLVEKKNGGSSMAHLMSGCISTMFRGPR